jgi:hypothetical protein
VPNIADCIVNARDGGEIDPIRASQALDNFNELVARYETKMPRAAAEAAAAKDLKEATRKAARSRFHAVVNQLQAARRIREVVETADDPFEAVMGLLEWREGRSTSAESVVSVRDAYERSINFEIREALKEMSKNLVGQSRNKSMLLDTIRELHGQATGNARAKGYADAIRGQQERLRQWFNAHGGDIGKLDNYGVRHSHDATRILQAGKDQWKRFLLEGDLIDWSRIDDFSTGKRFAEPGGKPDPLAADRFLDEVYESITTGGWNKREPSFTATGKALYNRRAEHRVLHFKDGDRWMAYNDAFGTQDPFDAMIGGLHVMARDIALMRVLGPNPKAGLEYAIQVAQKRAAESSNPKLIARMNKLAAQAKATLAHIDGNANRPENEAMANFFGGLRNVQTAAYLGGAILSSTTDIATSALAARAVGMKPTGVLARHVELMASQATRETAARMGFIADTLANTGAGAARYLGDTFAPEITNTLADATLRLSGLNFWTDMGRAAYQMEFAGHLAENAARTFDLIDPELRDIFVARGITPSDWDKIRDPSGFFTAPNGSTFISPAYWRNAVNLPADEAEQLAIRLGMAISEQTEIAWPTGSTRVRAAVLGEARPGTVQGELGRSVTQFRSFTMSLTMRQYDRIMAQQTIPGRVGYALTLFAAMTAMGAMAVQLKQIAKGRDPVPMTTPKFAIAAALQGGGLGIFGDFFAANQNRFGGTFGETLAGPTAALIGDVGSLTAGAAMRAFRGEDTFFGRDLANLVRYNTPVASSLWYTSLVFHRLGFDQFQRLVDPDAQQSFRASEQRLRREGTQSFWARGNALPTRAPDLSNALRTR